MNPEKFKKNINGKKVELFVLENSNRMQVFISNYGARILSLKFPDKNRKLRDIVLGYSSIDEHINGLPYYGAIIGRCANRISKGRFKLDGKECQLSQNIFPNHLHGGTKSFSHQVWELVEYSNTKLKLKYTSPHLEEGYPGELTCVVSFQITEKNELIIEMNAKTDRKTIVNLTSHPFFNLEGEDFPNVLNHQLKINADSYLSMSPDFVPEKKINLQSDSVFDFNNFKKIGKDIHTNHPQLILAKGYDHNFILNENDAKTTAASVYASKSGISMDLYTNQPGIQFYTGNGLNGTDTGKTGNSYKKHAAFCLEPQHFPDSPNNPDFPLIELNPNEKYYHFTKFHFSNKY
ncbi:MAG: galactose mutarotase [Bacteroidetes bacterium]|jgi:aldose 1-epimerase|nr:galactose mutarotase [Bacteroidota bacterium]MBT6686642.1 galactose mutarotase [Bacteroidota bacterium]MBT7144848.1 galactose mutarotase [Bacteroidota bacterium]MBT7490236.1 galactose mutarotase [Bacteroidota bacterium]